MEKYSELKDLVVENEKLIYSIANKFYGDIEDLFQVGVIGLMKARDNYNPNFSTKFSSYAYQYIFGEIYQYVLQNKNIRLNNDQAKLNNAINKAFDFLSQQYGRMPSDMEIADFLKIPIQKINENRNIMNTISLDDDKYNVDLYNSISVSEENKDDLILLREALNKLNYNEKELILKRYFYNMTQSEIAKEIGINQVKVSREEGKVLTKLRNYVTF
ncbi:MAG: sigma-70 family RNA polymerase sigma factor [Bacilli bacterium]|nr:sigma-70 family RNA polymerase sigma factor [Bacilli bacterium]